MFFPGYRPDVIHRRFHSLRDSGDEGGSPLGLHTDRGTVLAVDVDLAVQPRILRVTHQNSAQRAVPEAQYGNGRVLNFDVGMIQIVPIAEKFFDRTHEPL